MSRAFINAVVRRVALTQKTADRFLGKPFAWGRADCARMLAVHLRAFGHNVGLAKAGSYSSALGAKRALVRFDVTSLAEAMDRAGFDRIPPAAAVVGDVVELPGDGGFAAMTVALGNGRVLGWHEDQPGCAVLQPSAYSAAWRVVKA